LLLFEQQLAEKLPLLWQSGKLNNRKMPQNTVHKEIKNAFAICGK
jgi:hypothetical protein